MGIFELTWPPYVPDLYHQRIAGMSRNPFEDFRFERRLEVHLSPRAIGILIFSILYWLGAALVPLEVLVWISFFAIIALAWMASFSWRESLRAIAQFIQRLEDL